MPELHGSTARIYANGQNISPLFRQSESGRERELADTTAYGSTDTSHIISPMSSGMLTASGMLEVDPATGARPVKDMLDASNENVAGTSVITHMLRDTTIGDPGFALIGSMQQHRVSTPHTEVASTAFQASANRALWVAALHPLAARTAAHSSTALDNAASSANGGVGILHVHALTGTTPVLTVKVQHSTNGSDWVDLATFASVTAAAVTAGYANSQVVTGTVNRYLRIDLAVTSGSLTSVTLAAQFGRYNANK